VQRCGYNLWDESANPLVKHLPPILRDEHLIDRHLVVFRDGGHSHCVCAEYAMAAQCRHTRESDGRRAAQMLIANRVRAVHGTLVGFSHRKQEDRSLDHKRSRSRSLALVRVR
jgi:hypothetical protein